MLHYYKYLNIAPLPMILDKALAVISVNIHKTNKVYMTLGVFSLLTNVQSSISDLGK